VHVKETIDELVQTVEKIVTGGGAN
jgi:hypothetical protein